MTGEGIYIYPIEAEDNPGRGAIVNLAGEHMMVFDKNLKPAFTFHAPSGRFQSLANMGNQPAYRVLRPEVV